MALWGFLFNPLSCFIDTALFSIESHFGNPVGKTFGEIESRRDFLSPGSIDITPLPGSMSHHGKTFRKILCIVVFNRDNGSSVYIDKSEITPDIHPSQAVGEFPCLVVLAGDNDSPRMVGESVFPFFGDDAKTLE